MWGYPFFRYVTALLIGILLAEAGVLAIGWAVALTSFCLAIFWGSLYQTARLSAKPASLWQGVSLLGVLAGLGAGLLYGRTPAYDPHNLLNQPALPGVYEAVVSNLPETRAKTHKVELTLRRGRPADSTGPLRPMTGKVVAYLDKGDSSSVPQYGDVWLVAGTPRPVDPPMNPGEFDLRRFLVNKGIYHQQYLRTWQRRLIGYEPPSRLLATAYAVNRWADSVLTSRVGTKAEYGIVNAMVLGVRDELESAQYQAYAAAGAVHILSVSGLHVGILFVMMTWLLKWVAPGQAASWWVVLLKLVILWGYSLVTGLPVAVLRSAVMFTFLLLAGLLSRTQSLLNTLAASAFLILCYDPYAAFSVGFQLSYLAVGGIAVCVPYLRQMVRPRHWLVEKLWEVSVVAVSAQLLTFPLGLYYFQSFPVYFLLANPLVMGLSAVLVPLAMLTLLVSNVPGLGAAAGWLLQQTAWLLNLVVGGVARLPGAAVTNPWLSGPTLSAPALLLTYALLAAGWLVVLTRKRTYLVMGTAIAVVLAGMLILEHRQQDNQHRLMVHFLPRKTAISLTSGHHSTLLTDDDWTSNLRNYDFYLKKTLGNWGVDSLTIRYLRSDSLPPIPTIKQLPDLTLTVWRGRSLLLVNRLPEYRQWSLPRVVDYAVIRRNAVATWPDLTRRVVARYVIFDDSNRAGALDSLLASPIPPGIAVHALRRDGVFNAEW